MERAILHSDLNCFYASVEMMLDPRLRGKAVAVCGCTEDRHGIVLAKSEKAKRAGVKTGMVNWEAQRCCKDLIIVPPQYDQYLKYSKLTQAIYQRYTDMVEPFGTVKTDTSTDTQNNTISDSCFVLGAYSSLSQYIRGVVPGTYTISVRAKKTSTMSGYFYVTYNGNKTKYLFNKSTAFDWTDYSVTLTDVTDPTLRIYCYCRDASIYLADIMISEGAIPRKWTPAPNEIYTSEVKIDKRGIEVSNSASSQRTVITNTEFAGYYNDEVIFTLNKDETQTKKTTVDGELTVGKTKFVPMPTASEGLNIVILD